MKITGWEYLCKEKADELVKKIATEDILTLDNWGVALFEAIDTTPDEIYIRNALDEDYIEIPIDVRNI